MFLFQWQTWFKYWRKRESRTRERVKGGRRWLGTVCAGGCLGQMHLWTGFHSCKLVSFVACVGRFSLFSRSNRFNSVLFEAELVVVAYLKELRKQSVQPFWKMSEFVCQFTIFQFHYNFSISLQYNFNTVILQLSPFKNIVKNKFNLHDCKWLALTSVSNISLENSTFGWAEVTLYELHWNSVETTEDKLC